ncbi:MAG: ribonuclease R [Planctomycetaceae bacterium]|nr:ribonuclease R [Planctomycetaceae bacterium]
MEPQDLEALILEHIRNENYQPVKPRVICKQLHLSPDERYSVRRAVKSLIRQGHARFGAKHLVLAADGSTAKAKAPANSSLSTEIKNTITGNFFKASGGFGFVRPENTPASAGRDADLFIPAHEILDACHGDTVRVRLAAGDRRRGREQGQSRASIVEVIERARHQFVGTYQVLNQQGFVRVDGSHFQQSVPVGDPGAKGAQPGLKVVIEMVRFPSAYDDGEAVITEVLGERGEPGVDTKMIIAEFGLRVEFPQAVLEDARKQAETFDENDFTNREDLTETTTLTIDPFDARDFDDAISLEQTEKGHWILGVHIADVAHFVPAGSLLDQEATVRATSVYLPDMVIPMLPEIISNNLASLQPDKNRYAKTVFIEFNAEGIPVSTDIKRSVINSDQRFNYEEVDDFLCNRSKWKEQLNEKVYYLLDRMYILAMILRKRRLENGSLEIGLPEIKIDLDKKGQVSGAHRVINTESHQIIEEFMLAANQAVATKLNDCELKFLRRIHPDPTPRKLSKLTQFVQDMGVKTEEITNRFQIKQIVSQIAEQPFEQSIQLAILKSMQKAVYGPEAERHYALNFEHYAHFTSPIRRYPDLTIHRLCNQLIDQQTPVQNFPKLVELGNHCSDRERNAESAEKELKNLKLLKYLQDHADSEFVAVVTGVEKFGLFVQGVKVPFQGLISVTALKDDHYTMVTGAHALVGHRSGNDFRLGDTLTVKVHHVDMDQREVDLMFVKKLISVGGPPLERPNAGDRGRGGHRKRKRTPKKRSTLRALAKHNKKRKRRR